MDKLCAPTTQPAEVKHRGESITSPLLKKRSDLHSNEKGQFSLFQINTAAEEAILAVSESLSESDDDIFTSFF